MELGRLVPRRPRTRVPEGRAENGSARNGKLALWARDRSEQRGMIERLNAQVELQPRDCVQQTVGLGSARFETRQRAPLRGVHRRMNRVLAPFDKKRKQTAVIVLEPERLPVKHFAIRALARAGLRALKLDSLPAKLPGEFLQVVAVRSPADEAGFLELRNDRVLLDAGLLGIGRDYFEVAALTERKKGVLRAAARMHAAESRANPGVFFDKGDAAFKIARPKQDVIKQRGHLRGLWPGGPSARRDEGSRSA